MFGAYLHVYAFLCRDCVSLGALVCVCVYTKCDVLLCSAEVGRGLGEHLSSNSAS